MGGAPRPEGRATCFPAPRRGLAGRLGVPLARALDD